MAVCMTKPLLLAALFTALTAGTAALAQTTTSPQPAPPKSSPASTPPNPASKSANSPAATTTAAQLEALPLSSRNWTNFVLDPPPAATGSSHGPVESSPRGGEQPTAITVDNASIRLAFGGRGIGRMRSRGAMLIGPGASEAAIRSVQSVTSTADDPGDATARRANVQTERGTSALHGQLFLFNRSNLWGAQNPFTQWTQLTAPATLTSVPVFTPLPYTPSDHELTFGAGLGSRIPHSKAFWFAAVDGFQRNHPGVSMVRHPDHFFAQPSNDQMQVLSARLGLSSVSPVSEGLAAYSKMLQTLSGLLGPAQRNASQWTGFARLDWQAAERHRFTLEGNLARWNSPGGGLSRTSEMYGTHSYGATRATQQWLLGRWEAFLTPNLLLTSQGSFGHQSQGEPSGRPSPYEQSLNINAWGQLPQIVVDGRYGFSIGNPTWFGRGDLPDEHLYHAQEQLDYVRGPLLVKAGFSLHHNTDATSLLRNQTGRYYYSSVENFISDALSFAAFGINGQLNPYDQHNCDETGRVWRDSNGTLHGLGYLPCYAYYSQVMGPSDWWLSTNDWASYATAQWQPRKYLVLSAALRWQLQQMPPPIAGLRNPDLPLTENLPSLGNEWAPRVSLAWGRGETRWPVLRLGYGMYYGRTPNATLESVLTQTGSLKGDLYFFMRPTDNLYAGGAPPFPYVFAGEPSKTVMPGAVELAPAFRNGEVHQAEAALEEDLPGRLMISASAVVSLARRLPITWDTNIDPAVNPQTITYAVIDGSGKGPIKTSQLTVPFYASWPSATSPSGLGGRLNPNYQQIIQLASRANSTYQAAMLRLVRYGRHGLAVRARYTYAHAADWNPTEHATIGSSSVLDPAHFRQEYGPSNLDVRHAASAALVWAPRWNLSDRTARLANGWTLSGLAYFHSGLPFTMRTAGAMPREYTTSGAAIIGLAPGINGYGGGDRIYGVGRNTYRYPATWQADTRLARSFKLAHATQLDLMAESFNLLNHQNVTRLETIGYTIQSGTRTQRLPTLNFLTGLKPGQTEFGQPLNINATSFYRQRQLQFGARLRF